jgi:hypothetical protein
VGGGGRGEVPTWWWSPAIHSGMLERALKAAVLAFRIGLVPSVVGVVAVGAAMPDATRCLALRRSPWPWCTRPVRTRSERCNTIHERRRTSQPEATKAKAAWMGFKLMGTVHDTIRSNTSHVVVCTCNERSERCARDACEGSVRVRESHRLRMSQSTLGGGGGTPCAGCAVRGARCAGCAVRGVRGVHGVARAGGERVRTERA